MCVCVCVCVCVFVCACVCVCVCVFTLLLHLFFIVWYKCICTWCGKDISAYSYTRNEDNSFSFSFSVSAQDGIIALGKAHTCSAPSLSSLPKVALKTVPIFVWLNTNCSRPWMVECWPLPFSTPLSFRRSMLWCSGLSMFRKFLKPLSTSALPSRRPDVISPVLASLSARSFPTDSGMPRTVDPQKPL